MNLQDNQKYYHCYVTANEKRLYLGDIGNLLQISKMDSGCNNKVQLIIAISEVKPKGIWDSIFIKIAKNIFKNHPQIELRDVFFKSNLGRDFSSFGRMKEWVINDSDSDNNYIFFQNRSGQGPFLNNWYGDYIRQFNKFQNVAICGASINFNDYYKLSDRTDLPHVQTFAFMSQVRYMKMIPSSFPGEKETDRTQVISKGEIGLSQFFLKKGFGITCMKWKENLVLDDTRIDSILDVNGQPDKQAFHHRYFFREKESKKVKKVPLFTVIVAYLRYSLIGS